MHTRFHTKCTFAILITSFIVCSPAFPMEERAKQREQAAKEDAIKMQAAIENAKVVNSLAASYKKCSNNCFRMGTLWYKSDLVREICMRGCSRDHDARLDALEQSKKQ